MFLTNPYDEATKELQKTPVDESQTPWGRECVSREKWIKKFHQEFSIFNKKITLQHSIESARAQKTLREFIFTD